jgi:hypothetical protein
MSRLPPQPLVSYFFEQNSHNDPTKCLHYARFPPITFQGCLTATPTAYIRCCAVTKGTTEGMAVGDGISRSNVITMKAK